MGRLQGNGEHQKLSPRVDVARQRRVDVVQRLAARRIKGWQEFAAHRPSACAATATANATATATATATVGAAAPRPVPLPVRAPPFTTDCEFLVVQGAKYSVHELSFLGTGNSVHLQRAH